MNLESIYSLSFSLTGNKSSAELITINSFVNAFYNINAIGEDETFSEWLKNITINLALEDLKEKDQSKEKQKKTREDKPDETIFSSPIVKAYAELSSEDRFIFALNFTLGYPVKKIVDLMQLEQADIEKRIANSISVLTKAAGNNLSIDNTIDTIENIFSTIKPDPDLLTFALNKIYEIKEKEYDAEQKEKDKEIKRVTVDDRKKKKKEKDEVKKDEKVPAPKHKGRRNKKIIVFAFVIASVLLVFFYLNSYTPRWVVSIKAGAPEINNKIITLNTELEADAILSTNSSSEAVVRISKVGTIRLFPSTKLKRIGNSYTAKLSQGRAKINTENAEDFLELQLPGGTITDYYLGTEYVVDLDSEGNSIIKLLSGWLNIENKDRSTIFPEGYSLKILSSEGPGLPYKSNSNPKLVELLDKIVFEKHYKAGIDALISIASDNETVTLWNLLQRVDKQQRLSVYDKLYELVPHPDAIKKEQMLNLDSKALQVWLEEIEWLM